MSKPSIFIGTPAYSGAVDLGYLTSILSSAPALNEHAIAWTLRAHAYNPLIGHARADLAAQFMSSDYSNFLMIDADVAWEPHAILRMLDHDKDFIAGVAPARFGNDFDIGTNWWRTTPRKPDPHGLLEVDRVGGAFCLFKRVVFARLHAAYPRLKVAGHPSPHFYAMFNPGLDEHNQWHGEDFIFCDRWRAIGGEIFVDTTLRLSNSKRSFASERLSDAIAPAV